MVAKQYVLLLFASNLRLNQLTARTARHVSLDRVNFAMADPFVMRPHLRSLEPMEQMEHHVLVQHPLVHFPLIPLTLLFSLQLLTFLYPLIFLRHAGWILVSLQLGFLWQLNVPE